MVLQRIDYWNRVTSSVRTGDTRRDETVTDVESFVLPYLQAGSAGLHLWGVATGLTVTATAGQSGVRVSPGCVLDATGRVVVLGAGGVAVVDPDIDPGDVTSISTVPVDGTGVGIDTAAISGPRLVAIRYQEVSATGPLGNNPTLVHAPWLRLLDVAGFVDDGTDVVLAEVTLNAGAVTTLDVGPRRQVGVPAGRLQLHSPVTTAAGSSAGHAAVGELRARPDGGIDVNVLADDGSARTALAIDAATANVMLPVASGNLCIGVAADSSRRRLHVEGSEIHSGGSGGGFSFTDRDTGTFVETPNAGQRYVWYARGGAARLWSGTDVISASPIGEGSALDVSRRMRVRQGSDQSAGIWFFQTASNGDRAFVGMADDNRIGFWGNTGAGWGITMNTATGGVEVGGAPQFGSVDCRLYARNDRTNPVFPTPTAVMGEAQVGHGVRAKSATGIGLYASGGQFAALFEGNVHVTGTITKGAVNFRIDHPLDPERKILQHSAVESDELKNIYDGLADLDDHGCAEVALPLWFEALNEHFRYQLTALDTPAPALHIARRLDGGRFAIAGGQPNTTVCWQVTGVRHDAFAKANPLAVELNKTNGEVGKFVHARAHGRSEELSIVRAL